MLLQLTFLVLMLFGMAALSVDMGYVRLTQVQMQNAAEGAAMEGLRQSRDRAADLAAAAFADGLGPGVQSPDGEAQSYNAQDSGPYVQPRLQTNATANLLYGDMVSGSYTPAAAHAEAADYSRPDFAADPLGSALLVRVRRTDHRHDAYDRPATPGISSSGDALPLMFGRASVLQDNPDAAVNSPRRDDINVRATAIADLRPALQVGLPVTAPPLPGVAPFALRLDQWNSLGAVGAPAGIFPAAQIVFTAQPARTAGSVISPASAQPLIPVALGYAPIYPDAGNLTVIGFGSVSFSYDGANSIFTIAHVAPPPNFDNMTAVPPSGRPAGLPFPPGALMAPALVR